MFGAPRVHSARCAGFVLCEGRALHVAARERPQALSCRDSHQIDSIEGEWSGTSASFSVQGESLQLPDIHVPREYREWGIDIKDWASLTSINGTNFDSDLHTVSIQTRFMLPTVGCEADATSFVEDKREFSVTYLRPEVSQAESGGAASRGSVSTGILHRGRLHYAAGPAQLPGTGKCMFECGVMVGPGKRIRLRVPMRKWNEESAWAAEKLEVVSEEYTGPYKGGRELPMSCGAECGFSGDAVVGVEATQEIREAADAVATQHNWLQDRLRGKDFVRMPCGLAARMNLQSDRIGLQVAIMQSGESSTIAASDIGAYVGKGESAIVTFGISSACQFASRADVVRLAQQAVQATQL